MKRRRGNDDVDGLMEMMRQLDEKYELFKSNNYFVSVKNHQLCVSYSVAAYEDIEDLISDEEYQTQVDLLESTSMSVCKWAVDNGSCQSSVIKITLPRHRIKSIFYPAQA